MQDKFQSIVFLEDKKIIALEAVACGKRKGREKDD